MTLKSVLRNLQEIFPEIDPRILRAVAIEFSNDADAAVEFVLSDVLPVISEPEETSYPRVATNAGNRPSDNPVSEYPPDQGANEGSSHHNEIAGPKESIDQGADEITRLSYHDKGQIESLLTSDPNPRNVESEMTCVAEHAILSGNRSNVLSNKLPELSQISGAKCDVLDANARELCRINVDNTVGVSLDSDPTFSSKPFKIHGDPMKCEAGITENLSSSKELHEAQSLDNVAKHNIMFPASTNAQGTPSAYAVSQVECSEKTREHEKRSLVSFEDDAKYNNTLADFTNDEGAPSAYTVSQVPHAEKSGEYVDGACFQSGTEVQGPGHQTEMVVEQLPPENESLSANNGLQSGIAAPQEDITKVDFLDGVILDVQNRKRTLESLLESTINMLKEVKLQEELAEQAKQEASLTGQDAKKATDDIEQMMWQYQKTTRELFAAKYKLYSETQELGSQLRMLSHETENSLSVIEKVHETLVARLAAAKEKQASAEKVKPEKEHMAYEFLTDQEIVMNFFEREASRLHKEAEETVKLRECLMDHRQTLNMLRGPVASLREAVDLLNNRVKGGSLHAPVNESESSSMTDKEAKDPPSDCHHHHNHHANEEQSDDDWEVLEAEN